MKGVGGSGERLHSSSSSSSGPNEWEVVAMDYVDLNDLVPQVFSFFVILGCCMSIPSMLYRWTMRAWRVIMKE